MVVVEAALWYFAESWSIFVALLLKAVMPNVSNV
jgi:hypothetical protein